MRKSFGEIYWSRENKKGLGFTGALTLLFIGLKLTGFITWSWWWILSPIWIPIAGLFIVVGVMVIQVLIKGAGRC